MNSYILAFLLVFQFLSCNQSSETLQASRHRGDQQKQIKEKTGAANIVFKSTDGGQTWQDISTGLPERLPEDSIQWNRFFATDKGLFFKLENTLYHNTPNATTPFWTKEVARDAPGSTGPGKSGIIANNHWGANLKTMSGTSIWSPVFENFERPGIRTAYETAGGTIFIGTDRGFFKTVNQGKTWKHVHTGSLVGHMAGLNGVLLAISMRGIIRSTDDGETWKLVTNKGMVAWDVKQFEGGFVAITSGSESGTRKLSVSHDGGNTWQPGNARPQDKVVMDSIKKTWNDRPCVQAFTTSIFRFDENLLCTHPEGIFRSSDKGKTWKLLLPSVKGKVFNFFVSGNVIYAISGKGGC